MVFPVVMYRCESWTIKKAGAEELILSNCDAGEDSWESLGIKEVKPVNPKGNQQWVFIGRIDAEAEAPIIWPPDAKTWLIRRPWYWERLKAGGEWDDRGWDGWISSSTQWTWVWANSYSEEQGSLVCCSPWGSLRVGHGLATDQLSIYSSSISAPFLPLRATNSYYKCSQIWVINDVIMWFLLFCDSYSFCVKLVGL